MARSAGETNRDLEVRTAALAPTDRRGQDVGQAGIALVLGLPGLLVVPVAVGEKRAADLLHETREASPVAGLQALVDLRHQTGPGIAAEVFQRLELGQERLRVRPVAARRARAARRESLATRFSVRQRSTRASEAAKNSFTPMIRSVEGVAIWDSSWARPGRAGAPLGCLALRPGLSGLFLI